MARDEQPNLPYDLLSQLRTTLERMSQIPGMGMAQTAQMFGVPPVPMPGGLAAGQVAAIVGAIRAQRASIATMRTSLDAFEQQLIVLEQLMEPLESMTKTWAQTEKRITG